MLEIKNIKENETILMFEIFPVWGVNGDRNTVQFNESYCGHVYECWGKGGRTTTQCSPAEDGIVKIIRLPLGFPA